MKKDLPQITNRLPNSKKTRNFVPSKLIHFYN